MKLKDFDQQVVRWVLKLQQDGVLSAKDFCQDPETGLLCGSEPGAGGSESSSGGGGTKDKPAAADPAKPVDPGKGSKTLTPQEQDAITYYQGPEGFNKINNSLRHGNAPGERAQRLSSAISKHKLIDSAVVYRGVGNTLSKKLSDAWRARAPDDPPLTFVDKGFISTSMSKKVAEKFSKNVVTIRLPKGTNALPIVARENEHEAEILLDRGIKFKVVSMKKTAAGWKRFELELAA
jgi:ADP-ribosyltransferase exoenzyme